MCRAGSPATVMSSHRSSTYALRSQAMSPSPGKAPRNPGRDLVAVSARHRRPQAQQRFHQNGRGQPRLAGRDEQHPGACAGPLGQPVRWRSSSARCPSAAPAPRPVTMRSTTTTGAHTIPPLRSNLRSMVTYHAPQACARGRQGIFGCAELSTRIIEFCCKQSVFAPVAIVSCGEFIDSAPE